MDERFKLRTVRELTGINILPDKTDIYANELPYGMYVCENGAEILFNRSYQPILGRCQGHFVYPKPHTWVDNIVKQVWFYDDGCSVRHNAKTRTRCKLVVKKFLANEDIASLIYADS
jgi:hypothetical protein